MTKNSADAIQARVDNMYTDESVGRVYTDVMFLLLENKRLLVALEDAQRKRDDENRQKRQLHLVYMMTVEQLALAVGLQTVEGKSTQDLIDMATRQRKALTWYSEERHYEHPEDGYMTFLSPVDIDAGERARKALKTE